MDTQKKCRIIAYCLFGWIWLVSMVDHYFTIKLSATIVQQEKNPIGQWLLEIDGGNPALFMTAKMICLWVIALIIIKIWKFWNPLWAIVCLVALSIVQLFLVYFFIHTPTD